MSFNINNIGFFVYHILIFDRRRHRLGTLKAGPTMTQDDPFRAALNRIPDGHSQGHFQGRRYRVEKSSHAGGRSLKLNARALGGTDFISLNLYHLASGDLLKPCEMPEAKVRAFVVGFQPDKA